MSYTCILITLLIVHGLCTCTCTDSFSTIHYMYNVYDTMSQFPIQSRTMVFYGISKFLTSEKETTPYHVTNHNGPKMSSIRRFYCIHTCTCMCKFPQNTIFTNLFIHVHVYSLPYLRNTSGVSNNAYNLI